MTAGIEAGNERRPGDGLCGGTVVPSGANVPLDARRANAGIRPRQSFPCQVVVEAIKAKHDHAPPVYAGAFAAIGANEHAHEHR